MKQTRRKNQRDHCVFLANKRSSTNGSISGRTVVTAWSARLAFIADWMNVIVDLHEPQCANYISGEMALHLPCQR
jgi:hypothetical protein